MLADQMINRVEHVRAKNFIRREIKPENFLIELGKKYRALKTQQHIPDREN